MIIRSLIAASFVFSVPLFVPQSAGAQPKEVEIKPASNLDLATYRMMSAATFCEARARDIDFEKSVVIAIAGQHHAFYVKHGGMAVGVDKKIPEDKFLGGASFFLVGTALNICPKAVPAAQKEKFEKAAASLKSSN